MISRIRKLDFEKAEISFFTMAPKPIAAKKGEKKSGGKANPRRATVRKNGDRNGRRVMRSTSTKC